MNKLLLVSTAFAAIVLAQIALSSFVPLQDYFSFENDTCIISKRINLKGRKVEIPVGSKLVFEGRGELKNGTIVGNDSQVIYTDLKTRFSEVKLEGTWRGHIDDLMFSNVDAIDLLSNSMLFTHVVLHRKQYRLERWNAIRINDQRCEIEGNGVEIVLPSDKGDCYDTKWGSKYKEECLFSSRTEGSYASFKNIKIVDDTKVNEEHTPLLYYFEPLHKEILFENVHVDGPGTLLEIYNYSKPISTVSIKSCVVKTCQFAIEIANVESGHCNKVIIEDCDFSRYPNCVFCGPVSIVGSEHSVDSLIISNSAFYEHNAGNIEMTGVDHAVFRNNICSNLSCYVGSAPPISMECTHNCFELHAIKDESRSVALNFGGRELYVKDNTFNVVSKPYPFTILLQNELTEKFEFSGNTINYNPEVDTPGFSCLFNFKQPKGDYIMYDNKFNTRYNRPEFCSYFPAKTKKFEDPFGGKVTIYKTGKK